jgi:hypothetical protein
MILEPVATLCTGLFAEAAIYISLVEHPARLQCGLALAVVPPSCSSPGPCS